jgi:hypothetical protein
MATRVKAAFSHLLLSAFIFSVIISALLFIWYPAPYFSVSGGWQGIKIAAGIDLVLGPLLTLIVYDTKKSRQKLLGDLTVIVILQFTALAWGVNTIYAQRPVAVVFWEWENSFITVPATALDIQGIDSGDLKQFGNQFPVLVYAVPPSTKKTLEEMLKKISEKQLPPHHQINLYSPLKNYFHEIVDKSLDISKVINANKQIEKELLSKISRIGGKVDDYLYYPLYSKYDEVILVFTSDGQLVSYISLPLKTDIGPE